MILRLVRYVNIEDNEIVPVGWKLKGENFCKSQHELEDETLLSDGYHYWEHHYWAGGSEDSKVTTTDVTVKAEPKETRDKKVLVRGGRKGKGVSLFTVREIAAFFTNIEKNLENTPKRELQNQDCVDSPTKRGKFC